VGAPVNCTRGAGWRPVSLQHRHRNTLGYLEVTEQWCRGAVVNPDLEQVLKMFR
jgi:hypothetical protein